MKEFSDMKKEFTLMMVALTVSWPTEIDALVKDNFSRLGKGWNLHETNKEL